MQVEADASGRLAWGAPMHRPGGEFAFRDDCVSPSTTAPTESLSVCTVYHINVGATWHHHGNCLLAVERALVRCLHRPTVCGSRCIGRAERLHSEMTVSPSTTAPIESLSATVHHINVGATCHNHGSGADSGGIDGCGGMFLPKGRSEHVRGACVRLMHWECACRFGWNCVHLSSGSVAAADAVDLHRRVDAGESLAALPSDGLPSGCARSKASAGFSARVRMSQKNKTAPKHRSVAHAASSDMSLSVLADP